MKRFKIILTVFVFLALLSCDSSIFNKEKMVDTVFSIDGLDLTFGNETEGYYPVTKIWIVGDFNNWDPEDKTCLMTKESDNFFRYTMTLEEGTQVVFKVIMATENIPEGSWIASMKDLYTQGWMVSPQKSLVNFADDDNQGKNAVYFVE